MAVSKQPKTREGSLAGWRRALRASRGRPRGGPKAPDESDPPTRPPLVFGVGLVAVVFVVSLAAYKLDIPQLYPMLGAGVGAIAGFWLFEEIRRLL